MRVSGQKPKKRYGIALKVKEILTKWLAKDDLITPIRVLSRLINRRKANTQAKNPNSKYVFSKSLLPSLKQVIIVLYFFFFFSFYILN